MNQPPTSDTPQPHSTAQNAASGDLDAMVTVLAQASEGLDDHVAVTDRRGDPADGEDPDVVYVDVACTHVTPAIECTMTITVRLDSLIAGDPATIVERARTALDVIADEVTTKAHRTAEHATITLSATDDEDTP